jgi:radical SAM protein with 4Fe4S-binding SPASM domain
MGCKICYSKTAREERKQLPLEIAESFVSKNKDAIENVNFGTGENTLLPEWYDLVEWCGYLGIKQGVTTNGYLAEFCRNNRSAHDTITKWINDVDVSIDFANPSAHNKSRNHPRAYEWAIETLEYCHEYSIEKTITVCLFSENSNKENLANLFQLAEKHESNIRLNIYRPLRDHSLVVSPHRLYEVLRHILEKHQLIRASDCLFSSLLGINHAQGDSAGLRSCRILPDGWITPSTYLIEPQWRAVNIIECPSLQDVVSADSFQRLINAPIPERCESCPHLDICQGGAKDRRVLWYNSLEQHDPYCPYRYADCNPLEDVELSITKQDRYFVHDDYLPTLIFCP